MLAPSVDVGVELSDEARARGMSSSSTSTAVRYATYRHANVDSGMSQPKAYDIARKATLERVELFMKERPTVLAHESAWLVREGIDAVLSDSTFLGCAAAKKAKVPAILVTKSVIPICDELDPG